MEPTKEQITECANNFRAALAHGTEALRALHPAPSFVEAMSDEEVIRFDIAIYELALLALEQRESNAILISPNALSSLMEEITKLKAEVKRWTNRVKLVEARGELANQALTGRLDVSHELSAWEPPRIESSDAAFYEGVTIRFSISRDSFGGNESNAQVEAFCAEVKRRVCVTYPGAKVFVYTANGAQTVSVTGCADVLVREIELEVSEIGIMVWNAGDFWQA